MITKRHFPIYLIIFLLGVSILFEIIHNPKKNLLNEEFNIKNRKLKTLTGGEIDLFPEKGVTVLNFFATWCNPCIAEFPSLEKLHREFQGQNLNVIGVWSDGSIEQLKDLQSRLDLSIPIVDDNVAKLSQEFKISGFPETFILNKSGVVQIYDKYKGQNSKRIVGPRPWSSSSYKEEINKFLKN